MPEMDLVAICIESKKKVQSQKSTLCIMLCFHRYKDNPWIGHAKR